MQDFKTGDFVQFKKWEEMEQEFGVNSNGNIGVRYSFTREMEPFCGVVARIIDMKVDMESSAKRVILDFGDKSLTGKWFSFSTDMIKKINSR